MGEACKTPALSNSQVLVYIMVAFTMVSFTSKFAARLLIVAIAAVLISRCEITKYSKFL
jgi:hypothetical protein